jgi:AcrR family transcriptional regulator
MAKVRTPRTAWIDAALKALSAGGPEAVRVEALAAGLGVSKGGFYWHFADRQALLDEMLDVWEEAGTDEVLAYVERHSDDPRAKIQVFFDKAPSADFTVELALRDWARRDRTVADRLRKIDRRRMAFLRSLFAEFCSDEEAEARAMLTYSLLIGSWFVVARRADKLRLLQLAVDRLLA